MVDQDFVLRAAAAPAKPAKGGSVVKRATTALVRLGVLCVLAQLSVFLAVWDDERARLMVERFGNAADAVAAHLETKDGVLVLSMPKRAVESSPLRGGMRAEVLDAAGARLAALGGDTLPDLPPPAADRPDFSMDPIDVPGGRELVLTARTRVEGKPVWIRIFGGPATEWRLWWEALKEFANRAWIPMVGMLLMIPLFNVAVVKEALGPLAAAAARARAMGPRGEQQEPLMSGDLPEEIAVLAGAVDTAMGRMREALAAQKEFIDDAAHELRTPLQILTVRLSALPASPEVDELRRDAAVMSMLIDRLLQSAQADALTVQEEDRVDLSETAAELVGFLAPMAIRGGMEIELVSDGPAWIVGDKLGVWQALRNVVENALRHSHRGGLVTVEVSGSRVRVRDRGDGIPEKDREAVFRRFWRADRTVSDGAGLGLSIVGRILRAHGGSVSVEDPKDAGPGVEFVLDFRPAPEDRDAAEA